MEEVAEFAVRITAVDGDFRREIDQTFEQSATKIEQRGKTMGKRLESSMRRAWMASGLVSNLQNIFSKQADKMEQRAEEAGNKISSTFAAVGVGIIGGFAMDRAIAQFRTLETASAEVLTLMENQSARVFGNLQGDVLAFQEEMKIATEEAVPALYQAISAGQGDDPFGFLKVARDAAIGGITDLKTSVNALAGTVNAYKDEAVTAERVSDVFFTAVKLGVTTFGELATAMPNVTATAAAFGVSIEETAAAVAQLTKNGIDTNRSTTFLNQALVELSKSGTEASKKFKDITGQAFPEFIAQGGTLVDAIEEIAIGSDRLGVSVIDMFGSVEAGRAVMALTSDDGVGLADTFAQMASSAGATAQAAETMAETSERTRQRIGALIQTAQQTFGQQLAPAISALLAEVEDMMPAVIDLAESLGGGMALAAQTAVPALKVFGAVLESLVSVLSKIPTEILALGVAYKSLNTVFGVGTIFSRWAMNTNVAKAGVASLTSAMPGVAAGATKATLAMRSLSIAIPLVGVAAVAGVAIWNQYKKAQQEAADRVEAYGEAVKEMATPQVEILAGTVRTLIEELGLLEEAVDDALPEATSERAAGLAGVLREVADQEDFKGLEDLELLLGAVNADLDLLAEGALENSEVFRSMGEEYVSVEDAARFLEQTLFRTSDAQAAFGESTTAALAELNRIRVEADLTGEEFQILALALGLSDDAAQGYADSVENKALAALQDLKNEGNDVVDAIVDQEMAMARASDAGDRWQIALGNVEGKILDLAAAEDVSVGATIRVIDMHQTAIERFVEAGGEVDDLTDIWEDFVDRLSDVEGLLSSVDDILRRTVERGDAQRRAVQDLDAAYEDLNENLAEFADSERLKELTDAYQEEIKTGIGPKARALQEEIDAEREAVEARRASLATLDDLSDSGREAYSILTDYTNQVLDSVETNIAMGASLEEVAEFLRDQEDQLFRVATEAGVSEQAMMEYQQQLDLTPGELQTLIELVGPKAAVQDIAEIIASLDEVPAEIQAEIALLGEDADLFAVLEVLQRMDAFDEFHYAIELTGDEKLRAAVDNMIELTGYPPDIPIEVSTTGEPLSDIAEQARDIPDVDVQISTTGEVDALMILGDVQLAAAAVEEIDPEIEISALIEDTLGDLGTFIDILDGLDGRSVSVDILADFGAGLPGAERGGVFDRPGPGVPVRIGEAGREYAINVGNSRHRGRSERLLAAAARDLGMQVSRIGGVAAPAAGVPNVSIPDVLEVRVTSGDRSTTARQIALDLGEILTL